MRRTMDGWPDPVLQPGLLAIVLAARPELTVRDQALSSLCRPTSSTWASAFMVQMDWLY